MINASVRWEIDPGEALQSLESKIRNKAMRISLSAGAAPVKDIVVATVPTDLGNLAKAIRIKIKQYKNSGIWVAMIGASSSYKRVRPKAKKKVKRTGRRKKGFLGRFLNTISKRVKKTKTFKNLKKKFSAKPVYIRPAQYQKIQDQGGKHQKAKKFIDAAFAKARPQFEATVFRKLREILPQLIDEARNKR